MLKKPASFFFTEDVEYDANDNAEWMEVPNSSISKQGRSLSTFSKCSDRTKRRRTENIRKNFNFEELSFATQMSLRGEGKSSPPKIVKDVRLGSP